MQHINFIVNVCVIINCNQRETVSSTATKPTKIPFEPIKKKFIEAIEKYKENHPEKTDEYEEFRKFFDAVKSEKILDIQNINETFRKQYSGYAGEDGYITLLQLAVLLDSVELVQFMLEHGARANIKNKLSCNIQPYIMQLK